MIVRNDIILDVWFGKEQSDEVASSWLNNEEVRKAIHAEPVRDYNLFFFLGWKIMIVVEKILESQWYDIIFNILMDEI